MSKFRVGDIVIGNDINTYFITNKKRLCKVIELSDTTMKVNVIGVAPEYKDTIEKKIGFTDWVDQNEFELYSEQILQYDISTNKIIYGVKDERYISIESW